MTHRLKSAEGSQSPAEAAEALAARIDGLAVETLDDEKDRVLRIVVVVIDDARDTGMADLVGDVAPHAGSALAHPVGTRRAGTH